MPVFWRGRVRYSPTHSIPFWAKVRVWVRRKQVMAAEPLAAGKSIESRQVRLETAECSPREPVAAPSLEEVVGKLPLRSIPQGRPVFLSMLGTVPDVERGDSIAVEVHSGGAHLKFHATAESAGRAGDSILITNPRNGRRFRARVSGKGAAVVLEEDERGTKNETNRGGSAGDRTVGAGTS